MKIKQITSMLLMICVSLSATACTTGQTQNSLVSMSATASPSPSPTPEPTPEPTPTPVPEDCTPCARRAELESEGVLFGDSPYTWENFNQLYPLKVEGSLNVTANSFEFNFDQSPQAQQYPTAEEFAGLWGYQLYPDAQEAIDNVLSNYSCSNSIYRFDPYLIQYLFGITSVGKTLGYAGAYAASAGMVAYFAFDPEYTLDMLQIFKEYDQFLQETFYTSGESELESLQRSKSFYEVYDGYALFVIPFALVDNTTTKHTLEAYDAGMDKFVNDIRLAFGSVKAIHSNSEEGING